MNKFSCILLPTAFLMAFGGGVSGDENIYNTGNYDYNNPDAPAPLNYDDNSNSIYYPDGYQNWHNSLTLQKATRRQFPFLTGIPLELVASVGGVSTLLSPMEGLNRLSIF